MLPSAGPPSKGQSIHINPIFKNNVLQKLQGVSAPAIPLNLPSTTHINPLFMKPPTQKPTTITTIHMNPQFLSERIFRKQELIYPENIEICPPTTTTIVPAAQPLIELPEVSMAQPNKIISKSRTRIIRESHSVNKMPTPTTPTPPPPPFSKQILLLTKRKLIRAPMLTIQQQRTTTTTSAVPKNEIIRKKERYKIVNKVQNHPFAGMIPTLKRRPGPGTSFVARYALRRSNNVKNSIIQMPISTSKKQQKQEQNPKDTTTCPTSVNKQLRLININGILYKSTGRKLQRNVADSPSAIQTKTNHRLKTIQAAANSKISSKSVKNTASRTLYVRGAKYVMDPRGFKLTRVTHVSSQNVSFKSNQSISMPKLSTTTSPRQHKSLPRRIDIGGVTYIASGQSKNVFVRTSTHLVLAHLNQAKQRSVHMLSRSLKKTNKPCLIFQRLGKCAALERNRCSKVHDKQRIIVCPKYLQGLCFNADCLLSHTKTLQKMPVCRFFLQGSCVRTDCPYLHKKLRDDSEICEDFRRGFCAMGEECNKQHVFSKTKPKATTTNTTRNTHDNSVGVSAPNKCDDTTTTTGSNGDTITSASDAIVYRYFNGEGLVLGANEKSVTEESDEEESNHDEQKIDNEEEGEDMEIVEEDNSNDDDDDASKNTNVRRKQLGTLPAFIPLS